MDVKTVCLGMLTEGPASGYDLKKAIRVDVQLTFFAAGYGSIYPALSTLSESGLVDCEEIPQEGKPDRKVYQRYSHRSASSFCLKRSQES